MPRFLLAVAALSGLAAVIADASATHLLAGDTERINLASTGARYGLAHAAVLLALAGLLPRAEAGAPRAWLLGAAWCFVAALVLFSGTLYLLAAGVAHVLLPLVPVGGTLFILGWAALVLAAFARRPPV